MQATDGVGDAGRGKHGDLVFLGDPPGEALEAPCEEVARHISDNDPQRVASSSTRAAGPQRRPSPHRPSVPASGPNADASADVPSAQCHGPTIRPTNGAVVPTHGSGIPDHGHPDHGDR
jgi:hypothetical protein